MTIEEKYEKYALYDGAKNAYYNGNPIMSDVEFDELERELNLENAGYIGAKEDSSYQVKHEFIMGSLSKVQIKEDKNNHSIDWDYFTEQVNNYVLRNNAKKLIVTPKYDGCSFEAFIENTNYIKVSTRGNGQFGKDISKHLSKHINNAVSGYDLPYPIVLRGEVLIDKEVFDKKYSKDFANTRSFVAGTLGRKYEDIEDKSVLNDLSIVIYDVHTNTNDTWVDTDFTSVKVGNKPTDFIIVDVDKFDLGKIYSTMENLRNNYRFSLDGFVIKPTDEYRENNLTNERPKDCVAVKFLPMIKETEIVDIEWNLGKTGEYTPVIITKPVYMDGKEITRASASNYGVCVDKGINIGAKVKLSLAGDIIPYIYEVTESANTDNLIDTVGVSTDCLNIEGCHLYKVLSPRESAKVDFLASCSVIASRGFGDKQAEKLFDGYSDEYNVYPTHLFQLDNLNDYIEKYIGGQTAKNIIDGLEITKKHLKLSQLIESMNYKDCGKHTSVELSKCIEGWQYDFSGLSANGYKWAFDKDSYEYHRFYEIYNKVDTISDGSFESNDKIHVILTGSPTNYSTKKEFLLQNPNYVETTKWSECKILFCGDLNSTSSKMQKAKKLGITIKEY